MMVLAADCQIIDCQQATAHLASLGARVTGVPVDDQGLVVDASVARAVLIERSGGGARR